MIFDNIVLALKKVVGQFQSKLEKQIKKKMKMKLKKEKMLKGLQGKSNENNTSPVQSKKQKKKMKQLAVDKGPNSSVEIVNPVDEQQNKKKNKKKRKLEDSKVTTEDVSKKKMKIQKVESESSSEDDSEIEQVDKDVNVIQEIKKGSKVNNAKKVTDESDDDESDDDEEEDIADDENDEDDVADENELEEEDEDGSEGDDDNDGEDDDDNDGEDDEEEGTDIKPPEEQTLPGSSLGAGIVTDKSFKSLEGRVCANTLDGIKDMGFTHMTEIQAMAIPHLLEGRFTLCIILMKNNFFNNFCISFNHSAIFLGTGVIVISPTRELSMQTFGVLKELLKYHCHTYGLIMGGTNRHEEAKKLSKGVNILVATPGRLLDHLQNTQDFMYKNLQCLIIDEADRILDVGFEEEMKQIIKLLPKRRQTMLFSATQTRKVEDLARISLKKEPLYVGVDDKKDQATVDGLEQGYVVCPSEKRFLLLFTFLKKNRRKKMMVFLSSCMAVKFYNELLNYIDLPVMCIHGKQKQTKRTQTFFQFCNAKEAILLCTDVAARGLDIPAVDWIVQVDPPDDPKEYIHRVGRTARGEGGVGHALLILRPEELGFLRFLKQAKVPLNEFEFSWSKISDIQLQLEKLIEKNYFLNKSAHEGYKSYVRAYASHSLKNIFDVNTLDLQKVALSFGFKTPPFVDLNVHGSKSRGSGGARNKQGGGAFGYQRSKHQFKSKVFKQVGGNKKSGSKRQFSR
ncbi:uncharacterized protein LOC132750179 [Ruditapes philippinarum]|uniref:uncharacterized protein LOC132750179 n=1 Tax=Ruditapes philippinarum TaxID=129788 RepID=UPI00295AF428|nr:uncharacterized protein LOC132750179 [Ruditapes philippinarum]